MIPRLPPAFLNRPLAHRALHDVTDGRPENSRAAVSAAVEHGFGIEIDLQVSHDDQAMVFHDYALDRLAEAVGPVRQVTAARLSQTRLRGSTEGVPTLPEILDIVGGKVPLLIELKDQDGAMGTNIGLLENATADALATYEGEVAVMSFNPHSVAYLAKLMPDTPRGIVTSDYAAADWPLSKPIRDRLRDIPDYEQVGASFISHQFDDLKRPRVSDLKASGADVLCWTIRSEAEAEEALTIAQNITFEGYLPA